MLGFLKGIYYLYLFWLLYLVIMTLYRAHLKKTLTKLGYVLGAPILIVGLLLDFLMNITLFTVFFAEVPKEFLVTKRLQKHIKSGDGWRYKLANFICHQLLNFADPTGDHCD